MRRQPVWYLLAQRSIPFRAVSLSQGFSLFVVLIVALLCFLFGKYMS
jgi:hypothetical protein